MTHPTTPPEAASGRWERALRLGAAVAVGIGALLGLLALGIGYLGVRLIILAATYEGEGSLGHVGVYIGAVIYPLIALLLGGIGWLLVRWGRRRLRSGAGAGAALIPPR